MRNNTIYEYCPHCDTEVELKFKFEPQICPNCGRVLLPCSMCEGCGKCPLAGSRYVEEEAMFCSPSFFGDDYEHCYDVDCCDGWASGALHDPNDDAPKTIKLTYPTLAEVLANEELTSYVLRYRGLWDCTKEDINYGDIMMALGEIQNL